MGVRSEAWEPSLTDPEIEAYVLETSGEEGLKLANFIAQKEPIGSVELLEAHPDVKPSSVRKVLYDLMEARIAEYEKDTDSKGWETFTWKLTLNEAKYVLLRRWADERSSLEKMIQFERDHTFYACPEQHRRMSFEDSLDIQFICPVCGKAMADFDNKQTVQALEQRLEQLAIEE